MENSKHLFSHSFIFSAMRWLPLIFLLTGCSLSHETQLQSALNEYAQLAAAGDLTGVLSGEALLAAQGSQKLMAELELTQFGVAVFDVESAVDGKAIGCVDLSQVEILNAKGELIKTKREKFQFTAGYDQLFLISQLEISANNC